jgi:hypothetical protein
MSLAFWLEMLFSSKASAGEVFRGVGLLATCFFGLIFGAIPALLFAWILRRLMGWLRAENVWVWSAAGIALAPLLIWALGSLGRLARESRFLPYSAWPIWPYLLLGPLLILEANIWISLPVGAATASVLFAIHRAFAQNAEAGS